MWIKKWFFCEKRLKMPEKLENWAFLMVDIKNVDNFM